MSEAIQYPRFRWFALLTMVVGVVAQSVVMIAPAPLIGEVAKYLGRELGLVTFTRNGLVDRDGLPGRHGRRSHCRQGRRRKSLFCLFRFFDRICDIHTVRRQESDCDCRSPTHRRSGYRTHYHHLSRLTAEWFPSEQRPVITGFQGMAFALGVLIGFGLSPAVYASTQSWPATMVYMAIPAGIFLLLSLVMVFGPKAPEVIFEEHEDPHAGDRDFKMAL